MVASPSTQLDHPFHVAAIQAREVAQCDEGVVVVHPLDEIGPSDRFEGVDDSSFQCSELAFVGFRQRAGPHEHRTATPNDVDTIWYVVENGQLATYLADRPGARVLVRTSPLSESDERELRALERGVIDTLESIGRTDLIKRMDDDDALVALRDLPGLDRSDVERMVELSRRAGDHDPCRCAVIAFSPRDEPPNVY